MAEAGQTHTRTLDTSSAIPSLSDHVLNLPSEKSGALPNRRQSVMLEYTTSRSITTGPGPTPQRVCFRQKQQTHLAGPPGRLIRCPPSEAREARQERNNLCRLWVQGVTACHSHSAFGFGWCVVLLKRHSSIVRRPGRTCKHVRCSRLPPHYFRGSIGPIAIAHALYLGPNLLTISLSKV